MDPPGDFSTTIKEFVALDSELKAIAKEANEKRKPLKEKLERVRQSVIELMKASDYEVCNFKEDKIELKHVVRANSLNKKSLLAGLVAYFGGDETRAKGCLDFVVNSLGTKEADTIRRTTKRAKAPKRRRAPAKDDAQEEDSSDDADDAEEEADDRPPSDLSDHE